MCGGVFFYQEADGLSFCEVSRLPCSLLRSIKS